MPYFCLEGASALQDAVTGVGRKRGTDVVGGVVHDLGHPEVGAVEGSGGPRAGGVPELCELREVGAEVVAFERVDVGGLGPQTHQTDHDGQRSLPDVGRERSSLAGWKGLQGGRMLDLLIRGGTLIDGTGAARRTADVAVADGKVVAVGRIDEPAERTIDADGALVTPGFVDIHTHYDGQATWDPRLQPSSGHGVTTIVMGNCGVGFAPVRPTDHAQLIELMEGVEDIPGAALHEGLPWDWGSIGEYLDALERRPHDIDFATQVCHGPVRLFVMGQRGADREPATPEEIAEMGRIAAEGVRAGALGFTTSRTLNHRTSRGEPTPTLTAARDELVGIARALGEAGAGVLQVVSDFPDFDDEMGTLLEMMRASGRPLSVSLSQSAPGHGYRRILDTLTQRERGRTGDARAGRSARHRRVARAPSIHQPAAGVGDVPFARRRPPFPVSSRSCRTPRSASPIIGDLAGSGGRMMGILDRVFELGDPPDYEPDPSSSIGARAAALGANPAELLYDLLLGDGGQALLYWPILNYFDGNLDPAAEMLSHPACRARV